MQRLTMREYEVPETVPTARLPYQRRSPWRLPAAGLVAWIVTSRLLTPLHGSCKGPMALDYVDSCRSNVRNATIRRSGQWRISMLMRTMLLIPDESLMLIPIISRNKGRRRIAGNAVGVFDKSAPQGGQVMACALAIFSLTLLMSLMSQAVTLFLRDFDQ